MKQRVERIDPSPMNRLRWCLQLACGHERWVTAKKQPTIRFAECPDSGCVATPETGAEK